MDGYEYGFSKGITVRVWRGRLLDFDNPVLNISEMNLLNLSRFFSYKWDKNREKLKNIISK